LNWILVVDQSLGWNIVEDVLTALDEELVNMLLDLESKKSFLGVESFAEQEVVEEIF
jgi:hypothetical protein